MDIYSPGRSSSKSVDQGDNKADLCGYFSSEGTGGSCDNNPQVPPALQGGNYSFSVSKKTLGTSNCRKENSN